jgi:hypothetical protein
MTKLVEINLCEDCPYFDYEYYDYAAFCTQLKRKIELTQQQGYLIPTDCPLPDANTHKES